MNHPQLLLSFSYQILSNSNLCYHLLSPNVMSCHPPCEPKVLSVIYSDCARALLKSYTVLHGLREELKASFNGASNTLGNLTFLIISSILQLQSAQTAHRFPDALCSYNRLYLCPDCSLCLECHPPLYLPKHIYISKG